MTGSRPAMRALGILLAAGVLLTGVALSRAPLGVHSGTGAVLRVAWSARPERIEQCRRVSDEELAKLPAHMRRRLVCEGTTARYGLEVSRDGVVIDTATVRGGGMRHDREVYVLREFPVPPGEARLSVRFVRIDSSTTDANDERADTSGGAGVLADRSVREADERRRRRAEAIPAVLAVDTMTTFAPRAVVLVTYDERTRRLVIVHQP